jgi:hypothetical protein
MPSISWTLALDDGARRIELRHNPWLGRKTILVDGAPLAAVRGGWNGSVHPFHVGAHACAVLIRDRGLRYQYDLVVDGRSVRTGQHPAFRPPGELAPSARPEGRGDELAAPGRTTAMPQAALSGDPPAHAPSASAAPDPLPPNVVAELFATPEREEGLGGYHLFQAACLTVSIAGAVWLIWTVLR